MNLITLTALIIATLIFTGLGVFQLLLAMGKPYGRFVWGGEHEVLPTNLRIASVVSIPLYALMCLIFLDSSEVTSILPPLFSTYGIWVLMGYFMLGTIMNAISKSESERRVMTPLVVVLLLCSTLILIVH